MTMSRAIQTVEECWTYSTVQCTVVYSTVFVDLKVGWQGVCSRKVERASGGTGGAHRETARIVSLRSGIFVSSGTRNHLARPNEPVKSFRYTCTATFSVYVALVAALASCPGAAPGPDWPRPVPEPVWDWVPTIDAAWPEFCPKECWM